MFFLQNFLLQFGIANQVSITPSLQGATLVATKQSIKVTKNGLLR
ncbi:hypothetical protein [Candidatus Tisiphia endosymbiont of Hybos culiciformis]